MRRKRISNVKGSSKWHYLAAPCLCAVAVLSLVTCLTTACKYSAERTLSRASTAREAGDYDLAAQLYERYLQSNPTGAESLAARLQLANTYYLNLHHYEQALAQYTEYLSQAPGDPAAPVARERMAGVLSDLGRSFEAIAEYENVNAQDETQRRRIRLRIADLYFEQKNFSQALTEYAKVSDSAPYDELSEQAYLRQASIYQLERRQYQQALPIYQKLASLSTDPKVRQRATFSIADCYADMFEFDDAIKTLKEIKDPGEQTYVEARVTELEQQSREAARGPSMVKPLRPR
jgi:tetratricopeptide (TPR) repeat protein